MFSGFMPLLHPSLAYHSAIDVLRQVGALFVEEKENQLARPGKLPPSSVMIASPYDLEVRYSQKRSTEWRGYKVHLTETCEADMPHLIAHVETTLSTDQDVTVLDEIHTGLQEKALLPADHLLVGAYLSGRQPMVIVVTTCSIELMGPARREIKVGKQMVKRPLTSPISD
ncbi:MAG: hypothetical protein IPK53_19655 [bacterium]|nr:hypothetical protein [bacterium]